jgi:hypothetical protein
METTDSDKTLELPVTADAVDATPPEQSTVVEAPKKKRTPSEKQLAALKMGQEKLREYRAKRKEMKSTANQESDAKAPETTTPQITPDPEPKTTEVSGFTTPPRTPVKAVMPPKPTKVKRQQATDMQFEAREKEVAKRRDVVFH